jgi:hypothetical protein
MTAPESAREPFGICEDVVRVDLVVEVRIDVPAKEVNLVIGDLQPASELPDGAGFVVRHELILER